MLATYTVQTTVQNTNDRQTLPIHDEQPHFVTVKKNKLTIQSQTLNITKQRCIKCVIVVEY